MLKNKLFIILLCLGSNLDLKSVQEENKVVPYTEANLENISQDLFNRIMIQLLPNRPWLENTKQVNKAIKNKAEQYYLYINEIKKTIELVNNGNFSLNNEIALHRASRTVMHYNDRYLIALTQKSRLRIPNLYLLPRADHFKAARDLEDDGQEFLWLLDNNTIELHSPLLQEIYNMTKNNELNEPQTKCSIYLGDYIMQQMRIQGKSSKEYIEFMYQIQNTSRSARCTVISEEQKELELLCKDKVAHIVPEIVKMAIQSKEKIDLASIRTTLEACINPLLVGYPHITPNLITSAFSQWTDIIYNAIFKKKPN